MPTVAPTSAVHRAQAPKPPSTAVLAGRAVSPVRARPSVVPWRSGVVQRDAPVTVCHQAALRAGHCPPGLAAALLRGRPALHSAGVRRAPTPRLRGRVRSCPALHGGVYARQRALRGPRRADQRGATAPLSPAQHGLTGAAVPRATGATTPGRPAAPPAVRGRPSRSGPRLPGETGGEGRAQRPAAAEGGRRPRPRSRRCPCAVRRSLRGSARTCRPARPRRAAGLGTGTCRRRWASRTCAGPPGGSGRAAAGAVSRRAGHGGRLR